MAGAVPDILALLERLPLDRTVISAALEENCKVGLVGEGLAKLLAHRASGIDGAFLACATGSKEFDSEILECPAGSRRLEPGESLGDLVSKLGQTYKLDLDSIRGACLQRTQLALEGQETKAYKDKYNEDRYVSRELLDAQVESVLRGAVNGEKETAPIIFITAPSGLGKTCFVRHLYDDLADRPQHIPLLLRGLNGGTLTEEMRAIAATVVGEGDCPTCSPVEAIDRKLEQDGHYLVILLDGVNEANDALGLLKDAARFLLNVLKLAKQRGGVTHFRIVVTSRPEKYIRWRKALNHWQSFQTDLRELNPALVVAETELKAFNATELTRALHMLGRLGCSIVDPVIEDLLTDPLLFGFYCELFKTNKLSQGELAGLRTPHQIVHQYWVEQRALIAHACETHDLPLDGGEKQIPLACSELLRQRSADCRAPWSTPGEKDNFYNSILLRDTLVFEEVNAATEESPKNIRFRYDRLAHFLIAEHALWRDDSSNRRETSKGFVRKVVRTVLDTGQMEAVPKSDVIRGSIIAALASEMEGDDVGERGCELAMQMLGNDHGLYEEVEQEAADACRLTIAEIVHDFLVEEAARWHKKKLNKFLTAWFRCNPGNEDTVAGRVLRRVVFNVLRRHSTSDKDVAELHELASLALLKDKSADPAVLLHALYREGKHADAIAILNKSIEFMYSDLKTFLRSPAHWRNYQQYWMPRGKGMQRLGLAMILLFPDALSDDGFKGSRAKVFKWPIFDGIVALVVAGLTEQALAANTMPIRLDEWKALCNSSVKIQALVRTTELLTPWGWSASDASNLVGRALKDSTVVQNAYVTQLLSNALSCQVLTQCSATEMHQPGVPFGVLDVVEGRVLWLCNEHARLADVENDVDKTGQMLDKQHHALRCEVSSQSYLLSLVFYHLIVFDHGPLVNRPSIDREGALRAFELMLKLADQVMLSNAYLGHFWYVKDGRRETSNVVGTLGRCALALGKEDVFRQMITKKASDLALTNDSFAQFLLKSLGTVGVLSKDPEFALDCLYEAGATIGISTLKEDKETDHLKEERKPDQPNFKSDKMKWFMAALHDIRAVHPFFVEKYLSTRRVDIDKGVPFLNELRRMSSAEPDEAISRYTSWVFEHCIERIVAEYPDAVEVVARDAYRNLTPRGLSAVAARTVFRLGFAARLKQPGAVRMFVAKWLGRAGGKSRQQPGAVRMFVADWLGRAGGAGGRLVERRQSSKTASTKIAGAGVIHS